jgi:hypothetical protein
MILKISYQGLKRNLLILFLLFGFLLVHCDNRPIVIEESSLVDSATITIKPQNYHTQIDISAFIDTVKFVTLEYCKESLIGNIASVVVFENRIYIFDNITYSILVFNLDGEYISKISRIGRGPGEYIQLDFFDIDFDHRQIVLTDLMGYWVLRYDLIGNFISRKKIPFWIEGLTPIFNNGVVVYANHRDNKLKFRQEYNIFYLDSLMNVSKAFFPYNSNNYNNRRIKFSTPEGGSFYTYNNKHFFSHYKKYVYEVTEIGLKPKYLFDFGKKTINEDYLHQKNILKTYLNRGEFYGLGDVLENDNVVIFSFYESSFPIGYYGYFSKNSGNIICGTGFTIGENNVFDGSNISTFDSWIIATIKPNQLLSWRENIDKNMIPSECEYTKLKMNVANEIGLEDNQVLMFYKLKHF